MKFVHFADCHLDGFRDKELAMLGLNSFRFVIDFALKESVDFVLLAGDLFNTAIPRVEALKFATFQLKRLQEAGIPVYAIAGSHDFSSQGKSILDVLEVAGLLVNVMKGSVSSQGKLVLEWTKDPKTNALISGIIGKKGMLDKKFYQDLDTSLLQSVDGFKIFMFHTALDELKPSELERMESFSVSLLPSGCDYYAGGHVHIVKRFENATHKNIFYPGPTFPNSFSELESLSQGSFVFFSDGKPEHVKIPSKEVISLVFDFDGKSAKEASDLLSSDSSDVDDKIVLLRLSGTLCDGSLQDIDLDSIVRSLFQKGAFVVLKNTSKLSSKSFEEVVDLSDDSDNVERDTISTYLGQVPFDGDEELVISKTLDELYLMQVDGEKKSVFTERVIDKAKSLFEKE